jgi:hypothetical protein
MSDTLPSSLPVQPFEPPRKNRVKRVPLVSILLMVQGGLEIAVGIMLAVLAVAIYVMKDSPGMQQNFPQPQQGSPNNVDIPLVLTALYLGVGVSMLALGNLKALAGWKNRNYRGRVLGICALLSSPLSFLTCYCLPTGIALMIYGISVYRNADVKEAFILGEQGYAPEQIQDFFEQRRVPTYAATAKTTPTSETMP